MRRPTQVMWVLLLSPAPLAMLVTAADAARRLDPEELADVRGDVWTCSTPDWQLCAQNQMCEEGGEGTICYAYLGQYERYCKVGSKYNCETSASGTKPCFIEYRSEKEPEEQCPLGWFNCGDAIEHGLADDLCEDDVWP